MRYERSISWPNMAHAFVQPAHFVYHRTAEQHKRAVYHINLGGFKFIYPVIILVLCTASILTKCRANPVSLKKGLPGPVKAPARYMQKTPLWGKHPDAYAACIFMVIHKCQCTIQRVAGCNCIRTDH
jgi:hypothetical protein